MISALDYMKSRFLSVLHAAVPEWGEIHETPAPMVDVTRLAVVHRLDPSAAYFASQFARAASATSGLLDLDDTDGTFLQIWNNRGDVANKRILESLDLPQLIRTVTAELDRAKFERAWLLVRNCFLQSYDPLKALDLIILILRDQCLSRNAAFFTRLRARLQGGEVIDVAEIPGKLLAEAYRLVQKGQRISSTEEAYPIYKQAYNKAVLVSIAWIILGNQDPEAASKARQAWYLQGEILELEENHLSAARHWQSGSEPLRVGLAYVKYALRVKSGLEDMQFVRNLATEARSYFSKAQIFFQEAGFASLADFVWNVAAQLKQERKYVEAATLCGYLSVYFDCCQSEPGFSGLSIATLLEQTELWGLADHQLERNRVLKELALVAETQGEVGLAELARAELV